MSVCNIFYNYILIDSDTKRGYISQVDFNEFSFICTIYLFWFFDRIQMKSNQYSQFKSNHSMHAKSFYICSLPETLPHSKVRFTIISTTYILNCHILFNSISICMFASEQTISNVQYYYNNTIK